MTDVLGVHFLSGHSVVFLYQTVWQYSDRPPSNGGVKCNGV